ncbi:hypothetical protein [Rhodoligotrophos defluvii]|uniref:hypothetical protein n=1 Tax=Rhodoligotrophos defluvii TaxID=2561934 RepID=UPI0010C9EFD3|nr:hypothetical protein [Rhodoligotrophos defluvii]
MGWSTLVLAAGIGLATPANEMFNWDPQDETRNPTYRYYQQGYPSPYLPPAYVAPRPRESSTAVGNWTNSPRPPAARKCDPRVAAC